MADEKTSPEILSDNTAPAATTTPVADTSATATTALDGGRPARPAGWMYRGFKVGRNSEIWYASPKAQLLMVAIVCFLCPGMFNALGGMGGAGLKTANESDHANTALYSTFAFTSFFSGSIANRVGVRLTLSLGGLGYCIYAASFLCYSHTSNIGFVIFAGAFLGVCAGLLWTAQGVIMTSYPPESQKGRYISWFWIIFNLGAVIGSLIPLAQNINNTSAGTVNDGTYVAFIVLMFLGAVIALMLCDAGRIRREDGSHVILMKNPTWKSEFKGLWETLLHEPWILLLFPMFFGSNIPYTYQQNAFNLPNFNTRTRALNGLLYWLAQIFGAVIFGYLLDFLPFRRSVRAKVGFITLFCLTFIIWGGGWAFQKDAPTRGATNTNVADWTDGGKRYIGPMFLYLFYGFFDACWQTSIYWFMGALSNNSRKVANYVGFYKGIQSAGAAVFWRLDGLGKPYDVLFGATWGTLAGGLVVAAPVIFLKIKDTVTLEEDLKFSDETIEDVVPSEKLGRHEDEV